VARRGSYSSSPLPGSGLSSRSGPRTESARNSSTKTRVESGASNPVSTRSRCPRSRETRYTSAVGTAGSMKPSSA
jgi:hypothetical protein